MDGTGGAGLRERQRLQHMRRVQRRAVALFVEQGFDPVSVERIATESDVSPVSVYRWFGSKEGVVLWDEYDPPLLERVSDNLQDLPPLQAVREAVIAELERVYDADRELVLARSQLICREPALLAASRTSMGGLEDALVQVFTDAGVGDRTHERRVLAAVAVAVLAASVMAWQEQDGRVPLAELVTAGFERVGVQA